METIAGKVRLVALLMIVAVASGCAGGSMRPDFDLQRYVRQVLTANHLWDYLGPGELPRGDHWERLVLRQFPGGFAITWHSEIGHRDWRPALLFTADGRFIAVAVPNSLKEDPEPDYLLADVTGDGVEDLVYCTTLPGREQACFVYPLGARAPSPQLVESSSLTYKGFHRGPPRLVDLDGDGIYEIVVPFGTNKWKIEEVYSGVLEAWSVKYGLPKLLLALKCPAWKIEYDAEHRPTLCVSQVNVPYGGPDPDRWVEFEWDGEHHKFRIPELLEESLIEVYVNESPLP